ncbi:MAG: succinate dehydrogenase cytochrome b subunit [Flavihumibacter sp.]|nr:succinate dehydrogenase cytochrome b subunit [Flavihumibacter sp.]
MKWSELFTSSVGKKLVMALTGLFLITFLIVHAGINACIWADVVVDDNGEMFNKAAHFMGSTVLIRIMEVGLFAGLLLHIVQGFMLEFKNRSTRKSKYAVNYGNTGSKWYSRSMGLLGTLLLLFLVLHISHFWVPSRITHDMSEVWLSNGVVTHNLYQKMIDVFQSPWVVAVYVLGCISLAWHLLHGFQSAFRTLGVSNSRYIALINAAGVGFSIIVPLAFAMMPISMHFGWVN